MCGIAGILYAQSGRPVSIPALRAMADSVAHRGPDAEGLWTEPGIGLAHRRLSIIDVTGGQQPISNEDGTVHVILNGEIYNFLELRRLLEQKGHRFTTRSDTEVLVHLYEEDGIDLVHRLRGMFAFAIWDSARKRLLLGRDRLGIKPLYVYRDAEKVLFGSELKSIIRCGTVPRAIDVRALEDYLAFGMTCGSRSILEGVEKLPPGHVLVLTPSTMDAAPRSYWQLRVEPDERLTAEEWQEAIRAKVDETVRVHMIADVPVGAFLSGGMDSSIVVESGSRHVGRPLQTFSVGFEERAFSELPYAREVADQFGTEHVEEIATPDAVSALDDMVHWYDEPFADASAIPTLLVSKLASRSVKVALSGDGGDEAFGGYAHFVQDLKEAAVRRRVPEWARRQLLSRVAAAWPKADWLPRPLRLKMLLTNLTLDGASAFANTVAMCRPPLRRQLMASEIVAHLNGHDSERAVRDGYRLASADDPLAGMTAAQVATFLPDDFLVKVDRASMAYGLEVRPPFLDHELMELAARIPSSYKIRGNQTKWILKQAFRDRLPAGVISRRKQGFEVPIDAWLRGPLRGMFEDTVLGSTGQIARLVNQDTARALYRSHVNGTGRHGNVLWALVVLARWADRYLEAPCPA